MMDPDTGKIYNSDDLLKVAKEYVPFQNGEFVELKGCFFEIIKINLNPFNQITLMGITRERFERRAK